MVQSLIEIHWDIGAAKPQSSANPNQKSRYFIFVEA